MVEVWRDIKGYEGQYQISNLGRVKSLQRWSGTQFYNREKVNKFNIDKINNENKSLKGSCKILGEKNNNQRKELQRLNNKIEKLKVINKEHKKLNGELREENQKYKEVIDKAINDLNIIIDIVRELPLGSDCWIIDRLEANKSILKEVSE